jgi:hypothetical protein
VRLTLRPVVDADVPWLDGWLAPVAASVRYGDVNGAGPGLSLIERMRAEPSLRARIIARDGDDAGLVVYRVDAPRRGAAIIEIIATPPKQARRGSGMSAEAAVEDELRAAAVRVVYASAPVVHGIATYFWIRLGYRPLLRGEWPCERPGVAWLAREL